MASPPSPPPPEPRAGASSLRTFVAVARAGSVGQAAELLGRTQPGVSARIAALEAAWGTALFRRMPRGMELTPEGARLLPLAEAALHGLEALDRAAGLPLAEEHEVRIGAGDALGREMLPRALSRLLRREARLSIRVEEGPAAKLLAALRAGTLDIALVALPAWAGIPPGIVTEPVLESEVELLAPADWSRTRGAVPLERLAGERLVTLQPDSSFRRHLEEGFEAAGLPFQPSVEVGNLSLVRRFVAAGLGVAPVPSVAFPRGSDRGGVARFPLRGVLSVRYHRAVRAGVPLSSGASLFLQQLKDLTNGRKR
jgi:DNA-binding transcriptional LysR family regulator